MLRNFNIDQILKCFYVLVIIEGIILALPSVRYSFKAWYCLAVSIAFLLREINDRYKRRDKNWAQIDEHDIALVTGGSRGLGIEIVKKLLDRKICLVFVLDIIEPEIKDERIVYRFCDLADENQCHNQVSSIVEELNVKGRNISILVNNAGIRHNESLLNLSPKKIRKIFEVNSFSQIWILKLILNNHIENIIPINPDRRLFVISISSILGTLAPKNLSIYAASKSVIIQVHEALSREVEQFSSIRFLLVTPGQLSTEMFQDVKPKRTFFAPIVNHVDLATSIVKKLSRGERGNLCEPLYANFLPIVRVLPIMLQDICRRFSQMDDQIKEDF